MRRAAAAVLVVLVAAGCSKADNGYTEDVKNTFLVSCTHREAQPDQLCRCIFDEIKAQIPFDRYVEFDKQMQKDDKFVPDEYKSIAADCGSRVQSSSSSASSSSSSSRSSSSSSSSSN